MDDYIVRKTTSNPDWKSSAVLGCYHDMQDMFVEQNA